jgi:hypothetical protein
MGSSITLSHCGRRWDGLETRHGGSGVSITNVLGCRARVNVGDVDIVSVALDLVSSSLLSCTKGPSLLGPSCNWRKRRSALLDVSPYSSFLTHPVCCTVAHAGRIGPLGSQLGSPLIGGLFRSSLPHAKQPGLRPRTTIGAGGGDGWATSSTLTPPEACCCIRTPRLRVPTFIFRRS